MKQIYLDDKDCSRTTMEKVNGVSPANNRKRILLVDEVDVFFGK